MVVEELMTRAPVRIDARAPLTEAIAILHDLDVRHVPVVQNDEVVGMLSDRDLRGAHLPSLEDGDDQTLAERLARPVSGFMSGDVISVTPESEVTEAIELMVDRKVGAIAVVDEHGRELVGIVSYIDVLRAASEYL